MGVLWVDDEVICGFGRMGTWFAYQNYPDVKPEIITVGKGLSNAVFPVSGVIVSKDIANFFDEFLWNKGGTHFAYPIGMVAVVFTIKP